MSKNKPSKKKGYAFVSNQWIFDDRIKNELRLLIYISSLTAKNGFAFASNEHLAKEFNLTQVHISRQIKKLIDLGYIECEYTYSGKVIKSRQIRLTSISMADNMNVKGAVNTDVKDNITSNNTNRENSKAHSQKEKLINSSSQGILNNLNAEEKEAIEYSKQLKREQEQAKRVKELNNYPDDWVKTPNGDYRPPHQKDKYQDQRDPNPRNLEHYQFAKGICTGKARANYYATYF